MSATDAERDAIVSRIPHRPPMLLVDRIVSLDEGVRGTGTKAIRADDPFLVGHFPGSPIFPGCLVLEAMAQMAAIVGGGANHSRPLYLLKVDNLRFRRPVLPGDELELEAVIEKTWGEMSKAHTVARVRCEVVASADLTAG